jgi:drug/metabolite transporter (DMT)-like permease
MLHLLGVAAAVMISFSAIFIRYADVSPSTAAFFRPAYALPLIALLYALTRRHDTRSRRERGATVAAGGLMGLSFTLWNYSIAFVGAGLATVLGNTQVVFVGLFAWLVYRERPPAATVLAVPLVLGGVVLTTGAGRPDAYGAEPLLGVLYGVFNALSYTTFLLIFRRTAHGLSSPSGPLLDATIGAAVATLLLGVVTDPGFDLRPAWPAHGWLLALAVGSQTIAWWAILTVLPRLPALDTSVILLIQPMLTVVWGRLLFDERLSWLQWAGVSAVLAGVTLVMVAGARRRARAGRVPAAGPRGRVATGRAGDATSQSRRW